MNDRDLDILLEQAAETPAARPRVTAATHDLIERVRADGDQHDTSWFRRSARRAAQSPRRRRVMIGGAVTAGALLTAGTTLSAYYLQIPPFQGLPDGFIRTSESIPLNYVEDDGSEIRCRIFLEFERTDQSTVDRVDAAIAEHDWSAFGQDLYDSNPEIPDLPADHLGPGDIMGPAGAAAEGFANDVVPDVGGLGARPDGPAVGAIAATCLPSAQ